MNRLLFLLIGFMLALAPPIRADEVEHLTFRFNLDEFDIEYNGNLVKIRDKMGRESFNQDYPNMPEIAPVYKISPGYRIKEVQWSVPEKVVIAENVELVARPFVWIHGYPRPEEWRKFDYSGVFPGPEKKLTWNAEYNSRYNMVVFYTLPFEFDPETRTLSFTPIYEVEVTLEYSPDNTDTKKLKNAKSPGSPILKEWDLFSSGLLRSDNSNIMNEEEISLNSLDKDFDFYCSLKIFERLKN